ncbi:MAG: class I SAM-dependent methyltransferase [Desulfobacterales bacterium]|nr:class I SAM-dependent methyltransferase [Desulfobacterales bacterium]
MEKFFVRFKNREKMKIKTEEIIPDENVQEEKAVYRFYAQGVKKRSLDNELRFYRQKSLVGGLDVKDFEGLNDILELTKKYAQYDGYMMPGTNEESGKFYAYARVNSYAMLIAQVLFVNKMVQEGLTELVDNESVTSALDGVSEKVREYSDSNQALISDDEARFYAALLLLQTAFDKLFVSDRKIIDYDLTTGDYEVTDLYDEYTSYLELANRRVLDACDAEKKLCYNIATGWSDGIDLTTWNKLNHCYYSAISPTTGKDNLFTKNYDVILERMLPQFTLARVKLAEQVIIHKPRGNKMKIVEIGAGSGAFAIDLIMACKRLGMPVSEIEYHGVEPSEYMRKNFNTNIGRKIGRFDLPEDWRLVDGSLESLTADPLQYICGEQDTVVVISYCIHHCFGRSVEKFFNSSEIKKNVRAIYVLDAVKEHGWAKVYYMWADCESPENFDNITVKGIWDSEMLWTEPCKPIEGSSVTNAWCCLRKLT